MSKADFPEISENDIVVDALFGSGLTRPLEGTLKMTKKSDYVYSIVPSGKAINGDSRPINFTLNCAEVPF